MNLDYNVVISPLSPELFEKSMLDNSPKVLNRSNIIDFAKIATGLVESSEIYKDMEPIDALLQFYASNFINGVRVSSWDYNILHLLCASPSGSTILCREIELQKSLENFPKVLLQKNTSEKTEYLQEQEQIHEHTLKSNEIKAKILKAVNHNNKTAEEYQKLR